MDQLLHYHDEEKENKGKDNICIASDSFYDPWLFDGSK